MNFHNNNSSVRISNELDTEILFRFILGEGHYGRKVLGGGRVGGKFREQVQVAIG